MVYLYFYLYGYLYFFHILLPSFYSFIKSSYNFKTGLHIKQFIIQQSLLLNLIE